MKKYQSFLLSDQFLEGKFSIYLSMRVFVMDRRVPTAPKGRIRLHFLKDLTY